MPATGRRSTRHTPQVTPPAPHTCTLSPERPRSDTFSTPLPTPHERPSWPSTAPLRREIATSSELGNAQRRPSSTYSGDTRPRRLARGASRSSWRPWTPRYGRIATRAGSRLAAQAIPFDARTRFRIDPWNSWRRCRARAWPLRPSGIIACSDDGGFVCVATLSGPRRRITGAGRVHEVITSRVEHEVCRQRSCSSNCRCTYSGGYARTGRCACPSHRGSRAPARLPPELTMPLAAR